MLIDTHAHLDFPDFSADLDGVLARAEAAGIDRIVTIGTTIDGSRRAVELAEKYPRVYAVIGVHPNSAIDAANKVLAEANLDPEDLACIIPHQANLRIIEAIAERMKLPLERFVVNLDRYGNTSAGAVAIALDEANRTGRMTVGDYVLLVVFGGGLTWASSVIQW